MSKKKILTGTKFIIIKSTKPIIQLAGMSGFSSTPFHLSIGMIGSIVNSGHDVFEIVKGKEIKLTPRNYMDDFSDTATIEMSEDIAPPHVTNVEKSGVISIEGTYDTFTGGEFKRNVEQPNTIDFKQTTISNAKVNALEVADEMQINPIDTNIPEGTTSKEINNDGKQKKQEYGSKSVYSKKQRAEKKNNYN